MVGGTTNKYHALQVDHDLNANVDNDNEISAAQTLLDSPQLHCTTIDEAMLFPQPPSTTNKKHPNIAPKSN